MKNLFIPDALIFDVDGVLLNVERSFPEVIRQGILKGWENICGGISDSGGYTAEHERILKRHGAFNDDYDIAWTLLSISAFTGKRKLSEAFPSPEKLISELCQLEGNVTSWVIASYGNIVPRISVREMCTELYSGGEGWGLHKLEVPMLRCHWSELPLPVGIYTGRNLAEWELAKESLGWQDFPDEKIIHSDSGILKPSPRGLEILCENLGANAPVFFGDTASDMKAQAAFGRGKFAAIGELLPEAERRYNDTESAVKDVLALLKEENN